MMRIGREPFQYFCLPISVHPSPGVEKGGGQQDQASQIETLPRTERHPFTKFFPENGIFSDKTALGMGAWKFWLFITLEISPTNVHFGYHLKIEDY